MAEHRRRIPRPGRVAILGGLCLTALAGCVHYAPKPIDHAAFPTALEARKLTPPAEGAWTQADLVQAALAGSPQVTEAAASYRLAQATARKARVGPPMTMSLTVQYAYDSGPVSPWLYGFTSDIPLDVGARRSSRLTTADLVALQAFYDYAEAIWTTRTSLRRAVVERMSADREAVLLERLVELRRGRAARLVDRVTTGEDARPAGLAAEADLAAAERRLDEAHARRTAADIALAKALGVTPAVAASQTLKLVEAAPPSGPALAEARRGAVLGRWDVLRAIADYDQAEAALRLEVARQYPEVHLGPAYNWDQGVTKLPFNLNLILPPSDLNRSAIAEAEARRAQAGRKLETAQATVLNGVDAAVAGLKAAAAASRRAETQDLPVARRTAASAARAVKAGELDGVDLLAAQAAEVEAELTALGYARGVMTAEIDLEDALRRPADDREAAALRAALQQTGAQS